MALSRVFIRASAAGGCFSASPSRSSPISILARTLAGLAISAVGAVAAAGAYTEARRAPDQP
ncbi:MAG: hypothetical protein M3Y09_07605 [Actinomycetota bacterium]|nr:hypothetical protein [Actinomycetota bacterium]